MVFSSLQFVLIFMPIFFSCYYLISNKQKNFILFLGSLCFYFIGTINEPYYFILFISTIIADFIFGLCIEKYQHHKKVFLIVGVLLRLLIHCIFKYSAFIFGELGKISQVFNFNINIILPIGISFYTFQGISYIADVYKGTVKAEKNLLKYMVYISMFAQLIAGPIVTYSQVKNELNYRRIKKIDAFYGIGTFIFGLGLKVLLANPVGKLWAQVQTIGFESISTPLAWMAVIAYSFQIYFDFFGYSLMAIGLGKMLGFNLPQNFNHPYTSITMTDFWRRWHITLGTWFKEYVYIPLGGNKNSNLITVRNLCIVWLLTGIWHGAGYNFILWGLTLSIIIIAEKFYIGNYLKKHRFSGHIYMMFLIPLSWAIFATDNLTQLRILFTRLFPLFGQGMWSVFRYDYIKYLTEYYPFLIAGILFSTKLPYRALKSIKNRTVIFLMICAVFIASVICMYKGFDDPFLYFRF